jgi:hypothetical protein
MTGSKQVDHWTNGTVYGCSEDCRLYTGLPPSRWLCRLWSRKEDLQGASNQDRKAVWDQVGLSHCRHNGQVTVWEEARLRRGHNDQLRRGYQCSEATLTGESMFHRSTTPGDWTPSLMTGSKRVDHWTSGTVYECSEIADSPHYNSFNENCHTEENFCGI